ncbi:glycosyltransferase family 4 protein [Sphingomonas sp. DG1-23]|uniref:glycosyltransferase family 4 protein n=1 Tax=Sphingomonas sp. DG1-23 TaxID=3068316 RepID=UPI00273EBA59|nr:glycosyltransferase family 4 protein [Sphingomonas sp. DG1-23]MDP5280676.1 glycosyltransferase family 4 protein [Sphingomonas sp. DG1-23]
MNIVLSCYPLSTDLARTLARYVAPDRALTLNSLRAVPLRRLWGHLRSQRGERFSVVVGEPTERTLLPILLMLASLTPSRAIEVIDLSADSVTQIARWRAFLGIGWSVYATLAGQVKRALAEIQSRWLMRAGQRGFGPLRNSRGLYIKTNLMLGIQAGGSVGHVAGIANELYRRNSELLLLGLEFPAMVNPAVRFESIEGIRHYGVPPESNHLRFNRNCVRTGSRFMRREAFGYIYQRQSIANIAGVQLSRRFGVPLILEYNGSEVWVASNWGLKLAWPKLATRIEEVTFRHAHRIVVVSDVLADELRARGIPEHKIVSYPNCIDPEVFDPALYEAERARLRAEWGFTDEDIVCTFLGTFGVWHGAEVLADAINRYRAQAGVEGARRLRFLMIGDGLLAEKCRNELADAVAAGEVIFTGIVPQAKAPAYLAASDLFLSPHVRPTDGSRFFGSPTKLFEYMVMGKPIIASGLEQIAEVLSPGITIDQAESVARPESEPLAILVEPGSSEEIVRALNLLRDDAALRGSVGAAARVKALSHYTWREHVDRIFASLNRQEG